MRVHEEVCTQPRFPPANFKHGSQTCRTGQACKLLKKSPFPRLNVLKQPAGHVGTTLIVTWCYLMHLDETKICLPDTQIPPVLVQVPRFPGSQRFPPISATSQSSLPQPRTSPKGNQGVGGGFSNPWIIIPCRFESQQCLKLPTKSTPIYIYTY